MGASPGFITSPIDFFLQVFRTRAAYRPRRAVLFSPDECPVIKSDDNSTGCSPCPAAQRLGSLSARISHCWVVGGKVTACLQTQRRRLDGKREHEKHLLRASTEDACIIYQYFQKTRVIKEINSSQACSVSCLVSGNVLVRWCFACCLVYAAGGTVWCSGQSTAKFCVFVFISQRAALKILLVRLGHRLVLVRCVLCQILSLMSS